MDILNQYTLVEDFEKLFGTPPENYALIEEIAILVLETYSIAFPNYEEWQIMGEYDKETYNCIYRAILFQMYYIEQYPHFFEGYGVPSSYSVGRISVTNSDNVDNVELKRYSPIAIMWLEKSRIVVKEVCTTNYSKCRECGCDSF